MFHSNISTFKDLSAAPKTITLNQWLGATTEHNHLSEQVLAYRATGDTEIKKALPLATISGVCEGGRKKEDVISTNGWIALDIDDGDNPHIDDAEVIKHLVSNISYVAFAGLSASGKGYLLLSEGFGA